MNTFSHEHAHANSRSLTFGHKQSALKPALAKVVTLAIAGGLALVAVAGCASTSSTRGLSPPGDGDRVAVLITGTAHEPRPMLPLAPCKEARTAAESTNVTETARAARAAASWSTTADDQLFPVVALTPASSQRRGRARLRRSRLIEDNLLQVVDTRGD